MPISRREFLGGAALALALPRLDAWPSRPGRTDVRCTVLDLGAQCALGESLAGYRATAPVLAPLAPLLIIPAALSVPMREIDACLAGAGTVILESGAMYADARTFGAHRESLAKGLGVRVGEPVDLWPRRTPYVHYRWPTVAWVRDFRRVIPLASQPGTIIGTADGHDVALRVSIGSGQLVFLGSPLGPALWSGDLDAQRWLQAVLD